MADAFEEFGPYAVYERLGQGGMATVHRAEKRGVGFRRPIALKRLLPHVAADPALVKLFVDEARLASHLRHSNVAQTYELGKVGDTFFIAMEYASGPTLAQIIRQCQHAAGDLPLPIIVNILHQVCEALDYAHNLCDDTGQPLRIIHRDVSPPNIIVTNTGIVKLIDFGIAKATISSVKTQTGFIKGKFGYIAPEYITGAIDARVDLFAVGVVAHEMMSGRRLFEGKDDFETLQNIRDMNLLPPSRWNRQITPDLDDVVMTALQRDPAQRWQTAGAMQVALANIARSFGRVVANQQLAMWVDWAFSQRPGRDRAADLAGDTAADTTAGGDTDAGGPPSPDPDAFGPATPDPDARDRDPDSSLSIEISRLSASSLGPADERPAPAALPQRISQAPTVNELPTRVAPVQAELLRKRAALSPDPSPQPEPAARPRPQPAVSRSPAPRPQPASSRSPSPRPQPSAPRSGSPRPEPASSRPPSPRPEPSAPRSGSPRPEPASRQPSPARGASLQREPSERQRSLPPEPSPQREPSARQPSPARSPSPSRASSLPADALPQREPPTRQPAPARPTSLRPEPTLQAEQAAQPQPSPSRAPSPRTSGLRLPSDSSETLPVERFALTTGDVELLTPSPQPARPPMPPPAVPPAIQSPASPMPFARSSRTHDAVPPPHAPPGATGAPRPASLAHPRPSRAIHAIIPPPLSPPLSQVLDAVSPPPTLSQAADATPSPRTSQSYDAASPPTPPVQRLSRPMLPFASTTPPPASPIHDPLAPPPPEPPPFPPHAPSPSGPFPLLPSSLLPSRRDLEALGPAPPVASSQELDVLPRPAPRIAQADAVAPAAPSGPPPPEPAAAKEIKRATRSRNKSTKKLRPPAGSPSEATAALTTPAVAATRPGVAAAGGATPANRSATSSSTRSAAAASVRAAVASTARARAGRNTAPVPQRRRHLAWLILLMIVLGAGAMAAAYYWPEL